MIDRTIPSYRRPQVLLAVSGGALLAFSACGYDPGHKDVTWSLAPKTVELFEENGIHDSAQAHLSGALSMMFGDGSSPRFLQTDQMVEDEFFPNDGGIAESLVAQRSRHARAFVLELLGIRQVLPDARQRTLGYGWLTTGLAHRAEQQGRDPIDRSADENEGQDFGKFAKREPGFKQLPLGHDDEQGGAHGGTGQRDRKQARDQARTRSIPAA